MQENASTCSNFTWRGNSYDSTAYYTETSYTVRDTTYVFTSQMKTFIVPNYITTLDIDIAGAGGGSGSNYYEKKHGGPRAKITGVLAVQPGDTIEIRVGQGGASGLFNSVISNNFGGGTPGTYINNGNYGGSGGGQTSIKVNGVEVLIAGGGAGVTIGTYDMQDGDPGGSGTGNYGGGTGGSNAAPGAGGSSYIDTTVFTQSAHIVGGANNGSGVNNVINGQGMHGSIYLGWSVCDTTFILNLTVLPVDSTITYTAGQLSANQANASYQWFDCANGNTPIEGATNQTFTLVENGVYSVQITSDSCTVSSACMAITDLGMKTLNAQATISVSPNPSFDIVRFSQVADVLIRTIDGQVMGEYTAAEQVDLSKFAAGIYLIEFTNAEKHVVQRTRIIKN